MPFSNTVDKLKNRFIHDVFEMGRDGIDFLERAVLKDAAAEFEATNPRLLAQANSNVSRSKDSRHSSQAGQQILSESPKGDAVEEREQSAEPVDSTGEQARQAV